jgi:hypothetical protein
MVNGFVILAAVGMAAFLYWLTIDAIGLDGDDVLQGGLLGASLLGVAYLADVIPRRK